MIWKFINTSTDNYSIDCRFRAAEAGASLTISLYFGGNVDDPPSLNAYYYITNINHPDFKIGTTYSNFAIDMATHIWRPTDQAIVSVINHREATVKAMQEFALIFG